METIAEIIELTDYERERDKPMPSKNHALVQSRIAFALTLNYGQTYDFPTEISLNTPGKGAVPDVTIYPKLTFDPFDDETKMTEMPLCAIEIISASQYEGDMVKKAARYFQAGVKSYWLVNPVFKLIHVFSGPTTYRTFTEGTVTDELVGVDLDMERIFG